MVSYYLRCRRCGYVWQVVAGDQKALVPECPHCGEPCGGRVVEGRLESFSVGWVTGVFRVIEADD